MNIKSMKSRRNRTAKDNASIKKDDYDYEHDYD
jgi:hypothetical protein